MTALDGRAQTATTAAALSCSDHGTATLIYARAPLRDFGDGFVAVLLPVYLTALGLGAFEVGVVATLALLGSALMTLGIGLAGRARRSAQAAGRGVRPDGRDRRRLRGVEHLRGHPARGVLRHDQSLGRQRQHLRAARACRAVALGRRRGAHADVRALQPDRRAGAAALGSLAAASPDVLAAIGVSQLAALKAMFMLYAVLGVAGGLIYARIPAERRRRDAKPGAALGPSRRIVYRLAALFSIDAFAGGFAVQSLVALWLFSKFGLSLSAAGLFFFWSGVLSAFSFPVAAWLARRIGLVNTMVFTHIPSSLCLILAAVAPSLELALGAAAGARGAVADGRADALLLRHGGGDAARARRPRPASPRCRAALPPLPARRSPARCSPPASRPGRS